MLCWCIGGDIYLSFECYRANFRRLFITTFLLFATSNRTIVKQQTNFPSFFARSLLLCYMHISFNVIFFCIVQNTLKCTITSKSQPQPCRCLFGLNLILFFFAFLLHTQLLFFISFVQKLHFMVDSALFKRIPIISILAFSFASSFFPYSFVCCICECRKGVPFRCF